MREVGRRSDSAVARRANAIWPKDPSGKVSSTTGLAGILGSIRFVCAALRISSATSSGLTVGSTVWLMTAFLAAKNYRSEAIRQIILDLFFSPSSRSRRILAVLHRFHQRTSGDVPDPRRKRTRVRGDAWLPSGWFFGRARYQGTSRHSALDVRPGLSGGLRLEAALDFDVPAGERDFNRVTEGIINDSVAFHALSMARVGWRSTHDR